MSHIYLSGPHHDRNMLGAKHVLPAQVKRGWFRHFFVLEQTKGYILNTFVMEAGTFDPTRFSGSYYGPFFKADAQSFAQRLHDWHDWAIMH
jgi:hypothetical protein